MFKEKMKRVVLFRNGTNVDGKVVLVTHSLDELLTAAGNKFKITAKRLFTEKGGEIDDIKLIRDDDILYVSPANIISHLIPRQDPAVPILLLHRLSRKS
uniref:Btb poz domain-containing protein kctd9 n=1 Tax=Triatoma infestans TaxID=30076 RepID=A0A170X1B3_TRIIF